MHCGKESLVVYCGTDSMEVYVYIGMDHKINSGCKKSLFVSVSSQECGPPYTWHKYQRPVWSHRRLLSLWNKSTRFRASSSFSSSEKLLVGVVMMKCCSLFNSSCSEFLSSSFQCSRSLSLALSPKSSSLWCKISLHVHVCLFASGRASGCHFVYGWESRGIEEEVRGQRKEMKVSRLSEMENSVPAWFIPNAPLSNRIAALSHCYRLLTIPSGPSYSHCA